jgi:hypothetical protein
MNNHIRFSPRASLAMTGICMQQMGIWPIVSEHVTVKQKVMVHTPLEKLQDAFINIMAGGHGLVEVNNRVRPDTALSRAFGRSGCAEQSTISDTLNACTGENVAQMRRALQLIYQRYGQGCAHHYGKGWQVLDVDMSGMPAGRQGEGVEKGYFAKQKNRRGRQLGRVLATLYDEIVVERLYPGKTQLNRSLQELVTEAEQVLNLNPGFRRRTIIRTDAGGGRDEDINWLLKHHYGFLTKVTNWRRVAKLLESVTEWLTDPKDSRRQFGWVEQPYAYDQPTRQLAIRCAKKDGSWSAQVLAFNLSDDTLLWLMPQVTAEDENVRVMLAALYAYDQRGGAAETSIKGSKQGLGLTKRNKKRFQAQEMLLLLAQLAYNLTAWTRNGLAACRPTLRQFGMLRLVRDAFHISGKIVFDAHGRIVAITLNQAHDLASPFISALGSFLARDGTVANLGQI